MILHQHENTLVRSGITGETRYSINLSGKMYGLLTDGLYEDKIGSVVREVCSNAYDAHIAAGKRDVPFKVTLPTSLEPHFIVEDEGTGLPDEKCQELYSTLGLSTKESSNDMIGAFGLGSKSPYAVTDSFSIENTYQGVTYFYLSFKDEAGMPSILKTGEIPTTKPDGIRVIIPTGGAQYGSYWNAMKRQLMFIDPKPIIMNVGDYGFPEPSVVFDSPYGMMVANSSVHGLTAGRVYGRMGIVVYPINTDLIKFDFNLRDMRGGAALILNFNIGDLDPLPSRESLSYDDATKKAITDTLEKYREFFELELKTSVEKENDPLMAYRKIIDINTVYRYEYKHVEYDIAGTKIKFSTDIKMPTFEREEPSQQWDSTLEKYVDTVVISNIPRFKHTQFAYSRYRTREKMKGGVFTWMNWDRIRSIMDDEITLYYMDEVKPKFLSKRMAKYGSGYSSRDNVFFVECQDPSVVDGMAEFAKDLDSVYPGLSAKIIPFSTCLLDDWEKPQRGPKKVGIVNGVDVGYGGSFSNLTTDYEFDPDTMCYFETDDGNVVNYPEMSKEIFPPMMNRSEYAVFNVKKSGRSFLKTLNSEGIMEFNDFFISKVEQMEITPRFLQVFNDVVDKHYSAISYTMAVRFKEYMRRTKSEHVPKYVSEYVRIEDFSFGSEDSLDGLTEDQIFVIMVFINSATYFRRHSNSDWFKKIWPVITFNECWKEYKEKFPVLKYIFDESSMTEEKANIISDYIDLMKDVHGITLVDNPFYVKVEEDEND